MEQYATEGGGAIAGEARKGTGDLLGICTHEHKGSEVRSNGSGERTG